jgi:hypothetical protein
MGDRGNPSGACKPSKGLEGIGLSGIWPDQPFLFLSTSFVCRETVAKPQKMRRLTGPASAQTSNPPGTTHAGPPGGSANNDHSVVMVVVMMMMTPTMVAIRLCIRRSREEGDESEYQ